MSLRNVIIEWLEWGVEPGGLDVLSPEEQRLFMGDVMQAQYDWTFDAFSEGFSRNPGKRAELEAAIKAGDFMQIGAVIDSVFRHYFFVPCAPFWESEFTQIQEQESPYDGDE